MSNTSTRRSFLLKAAAGTGAVALGTVSFVDTVEAGNRKPCGHRKGRKCGCAGNRQDTTVNQANVANQGIVQVAKGKNNAQAASNSADQSNGAVVVPVQLDLGGFGGF